MREFKSEYQLEREALRDERDREEWEAARAAGVQPDCGEYDPDRELEDAATREGYGMDLDDPNFWRPDSDPYDRFEECDDPSQRRSTSL